MTKWQFKILSWVYLMLTLLKDPSFIPDWLRPGRYSVTTFTFPSEWRCLSLKRWENDNQSCSPLRSVVVLVICSARFNTVAELHRKRLRNSRRSPNYADGRRITQKTSEKQLTLSKLVIVNVVWSSEYLINFLRACARYFYYMAFLYICVFISFLPDTEFKKAEAFVK